MLGFQKLSTTFLPKELVGIVLPIPHYCIHVPGEDTNSQRRAFVDTCMCAHREEQGRVMSSSTARAGHQQGKRNFMQ